MVPAILSSDVHDACRDFGRTIQHEASDHAVFLKLYVLSVDQRRGLEFAVSKDQQGKPTTMLMQVTIQPDVLSRQMVEKETDHSPGAPFEVMADLRRLLDDAGIPPEIRTMIAEAPTCTMVYHACGSCQFGDQQGYLVEYFCTDGGSTPDYTQCSPC